MTTSSTSEREFRPYYIGMTEAEKKLALKNLNLQDLKDLYQHIPQAGHFDSQNTRNPAPVAYKDLKDLLQNVSEKNIVTTSFIADGLPMSKQADITGEICALRGLTTAYTPYQPERSQGTLQTLWIYQSLMCELTGFEAVNASLYDRATCLYEAILTSLRISTQTKKVAWIHAGIHPNDLEVLKTMQMGTDLIIEILPLDSMSGKLDMDFFQNKLKEGNLPAVFAFPQINHLGNIEDVDSIVDLCNQHKILTIAVIDPLLNAKECLKTPVEFGSQNQGTDVLVADGQHLAFGPMYGGPGLGIFGIRYNEQNKNNIRQTPGRFIGKAKDQQGKNCKVIVLSTREQHIRREKATSNICSNQSFIASATGAALLNMGSDHLAKRAKAARGNCLKTLESLLRFKGIELAYPHTSFWNEVTLKITNPTDLKSLIEKAHQENLEIGLNVTGRISASHSLLKMSFSDIHTDHDLQKLISFFSKNFETQNGFPMIAPIKESAFRKKEIFWAAMSKEKVLDYYAGLAKQNLSPDEGIYPLGSCTMKYNPMINDWAASLDKFVQIHPQTNDKFAQGNLKILFETQEFFKTITGLAAVTTQPVAGAQGELVGLKLFQAYHQDKGEGSLRDVLLIPKSAHGTNPATAAIAGFSQGIQLIDADESGLINVEQVKEFCNTLGKRIAGIMITNPNTSGVYEKNFKVVADLVHAVGGLVYMDGANMNAIAGWINLGAIGVDAVHNNLHKTWTIPHGGGGPGDAIVAVSEKLVDYLPGVQVKLENGVYSTYKTKKCIGSFHRHHGNFAHKIRCYTYIKALGFGGTREMSAVAVLSARYLFNKLSSYFPSLPTQSKEPKMHEFIITLPPETFTKLEALGLTKPIAITRVGKLFLDFGFHAPTVAFPEPLGLMIEPTESFTLKELDHFADVVINLGKMIHEHPEVLLTVPHFTPIDRVDEVSANKNLVLSEKITDTLDEIYLDRISPNELKNMGFGKIKEAILKAHEEKKAL
jgi:glycine dehydrogenase